MNMSILKKGMTVKLNIEYYMKTNNIENVDDMIASYVGDNKNLQKWLKEKNSFEVVSIEQLGIINNETWANVIVRPYLTDYVTKKDFKIELEDNEPIYDWHIESYYLIPEE